MRGIKTSILAVSMLAFAGNAGAIDLGVISRDGGYEYRHPSAWEKEQQRVKDELAAAQKQLADRDREIASLRSGSSDALRSAQADLERSKSRSAELESSWQIAIGNWLPFGQVRATRRNWPANCRPPKESSTWRRDVSATLKNPSPRQKPELLQTS